MLDLFYGNAVRGKHRFPRPDLENRLISKLSQGGGVRMFGLRRIGKSTLREYVLEQLRAEKRPHAFIDGQGLHSLNELLSRLFQAMPAKQNFGQRVLRALAAGPVRVAVEAISKGLDHDETAIPAYWQILSEAIRRALQEDGPKPVLVIDEFTYIVENMIKRGAGADVDRLLASMREWRDAGMTMLLTGSIGLTGLARRHDVNLEHVNDLQPFDIPELTDAEARAFIRAATETTSQGKWTQAHTDEFMGQVGAFYPCFLVRGLQEVDVKSPPDPSKFEQVFEDRVRPEVHNEFLRQFNRRFTEYGELPEQERDKLILPALKAILEAADYCEHARIPCARPFTQVRLGRALDMLVEDGFVRFSQKANGMRHWRPASNLAKMWWTGRNWA
jgi:hypothetical protein